MVGDLIHWILVFLEGLGYWGVMLGIIIGIIPIEILLAYAGYLVSSGIISFLSAIVFGTIGGVITQLY
ncbi:hypothetical protein COK05_27590 [Bacillus cereus]|uniref:DedA family protein n=1 Tax=Bacillus cereus TaxID=1396 RepID=A0A2B2LDV3_BACCE|nr:hypothetical protein COK05_27590 [Bacillus cereus]PGU13251.1 hypothetical protein COD21_02555 [Bacillus cereus]